MTAFAPVFLPPERGLNRKVSATMLKHFDHCPRSAFLYTLHKGEAHTPEMERGSAFHAVCERVTQMAVDAEEPIVPSEVAKVVLDEVLAEYHVPFREHDLLREMVHRWSGEMAFPAADRILSNETLFVLEVGGWQVRCRIDFAESLEDGAAVSVQDWKTSRAMVGYEDIARRRPDGSLAAKNMQLVLYGLALVFGVPVRVEECDNCSNVDPSSCPVCNGKGYVEIPEPFPVAARAQRADLSFVYPGIEDSEGHMARRTVTLTRLELEEYRASLEALVARVERSEAGGDWPAQTSGEGCSICPARPECPIPVEVRDHRGVVNTAREAAEAAERLAWEKDDHQARHKELRLWAKANGPVRFGADRVMEFVHGESERWDREGLVAAARRHAQYGEPFEAEEFVKRSESSRFVVRTLTAAELDEEVATEKEGSK